MPSYIIHPGVHLGRNAEIGDFVIIGVPFKGAEHGGGETRIGPDTVIRSHTVIYAGSTIGAKFQTGHGAMIRECCTIGENVSIGTHSIVEHHVTLEDRVRIHSNAFIPEFSVLETGCWVGPGVFLTNALYPASPDAKKSLKGPRLRAGAKIGANATILPGVVIGKGALIGAGAVVIRDVPDDKVVVGNPARIIRNVSDIPAYAHEDFLHGKGDH